MNPKVPMDIKIPRTLADARSQASEMVNPTQREAADRAITEAENTASLIGKQRAADLRARATSEGASAFERNGEIVSESRSMAAELRSGRVTTDDARKRLRQLSIAHKLTRTQLDLFEQDVSSAADIEADPIEYADRLYTKYPTTRPTFPF